MTNVTANLAIPIPNASGGLPLIGHAVPLLRNPWAFLLSLPSQGELVRIRIGPTSAVVVCDADLTHQVLVNDRVFERAGPLLDRALEIVGNGLITCPADEHRLQRRQIQPAFSSARLCGYTSTMVAQIDAVTGSWHNGQVMDANTEASRLTSKVMVATMFSDVLPPATADQVIKDLDTITAGMYRRMLLPPPLDQLPTPGNVRYRRAITRLRTVIGEVIAHYRSTGADQDGLLSAFMAAHEAQLMTDTELVNQALGMFIGGAEAPSTALSWALHLIAEHPDVQRRLQEEADAVLAGTSASADLLPSLPFTMSVVTETLRLWPPLWLTTRIVAADADLGGYRLPAGTVLVVSPYVLHRSATLYRHPERFDPDRWALDNPNPPDRNAFIVFGGGPRKCIGDQFFVNEAVLALATIASRWHLESLPGQSIRPALSAILRPSQWLLRTLVRTPEPKVQIPDMKSE
jgi:cytochrome P450